MIDFMSKQDKQLYSYFLLYNPKLRFWKDRHLRKLKRLIEKRYANRYCFMPDLDLQIEFQKRLCELR